MRIWRFFIDTGSKRIFQSTRFGGQMVNYKGKRVVAMHLLGRLYFICDSTLYNSGLIPHDFATRAANTKE